MSRSLPRLRRPRAVSAALVSAVLMLGAFTLVSSGSANAAGQRSNVQPPPTTPVSTKQIQNLDRVKTAIKGYYDDTTTDVPNPVDGKSTLHEPSAKGNYAKEVKSIEKYASAYLARKAYGGFHHRKNRPAILLDVDDTTLVTYDYEIYSHFVYNPASNADFVNAAVFPAVFGMPKLVNKAEKKGYKVFFLTGRPESQRHGTRVNLFRNAGFPKVPNAHLILKPKNRKQAKKTAPWLAQCFKKGEFTCSTTQYKTLTREHLESRHFKIFANFGDQYSDLNGGHAKKTFKMPNPMYYLP